jgi:bleomycin hydrolase
MSLVLNSSYFFQPIQPFQLTLINNPISSLTINYSVINENPYLFNHEVSTNLPITDQKSSGRCWLFATLNLLRIVAQQNWNDEYKIDQLEFSQNYLYFWDKLERYHMNLRYFIKINNINSNEIYMLNLLKDPMSDGGQWDMAKELLIKYGVVPKEVMPDTYHSKSSHGMNKILTHQLKHDFMVLSKSKKSEYEKLINNMIEKIYNLLVGFLGKPPIKFNYTFKSTDKIITLNNITPLELLEKTKFNPNDWVSVVNDPRIENDYYKYYQVEHLGNIKEQHVGWINLPVNRLKELTKNSIDDNQPVWFGCDVGAHGDKVTGIHHPNLFNLKTFMDYEIKMDKKERLKYYLSLPTHAMVILGYHEEESQIKRWKIENSWGKVAGNNGFQLMTDEWFDEYVYQVIIHKSKLNEEEIKLLDTIPCIIPPWDPLGTLAKNMKN